MSSYAIIDKNDDNFQSLKKKNRLKIYIGIIIFQQNIIQV